VPFSALRGHGDRRRFAAKLQALASMETPSGRIPQLASRLSDREDLPRAVAIERYWDDVARTDVDELFDLIANELGISPGLLRPDDSLDELLAPLPVRNPLKWLFREAALEDGVGELSHRLRRRNPRLGGRVRTVRELVHAWCHAG